MIRPLDSAPPEREMYQISLKKLFNINGKFIVFIIVS